MPEELREAIEKVNQAAHAKGKKSGMFCTSGAQAREFADQGFDMVSCHSTGTCFKLIASTDQHHNGCGSSAKLRRE